MTRPRSVGLLGLGFAFWLGLAACSGDNPESPGASDVTSAVHTSASGTVALANLDVPAGTTIIVVADVTFEVAGWVRLAGEIVSDGKGPWSITLRAQDSVELLGTVSAGSASAGGAGGDVSVQSVGGDVSLGSQASVSAGDGGAGVVDTATLGSGGDGGSVTLLAPSGALHIEDGAVIHLGDGGAGAEVALLATDVGEAVAVGLENIGGDGGRLLVEAQSAIGIAFETLTASTPWPPLGPVLTAEGQRFTHGVDPDHVQGGAGGAGGGLIFGDPSVGSTWPDGAAWPAGGPGKGDYCAELRAETEVNRCVQGGAGGAGSPPGAGGPVRIIGKNGQAPGAPGESVIALGGLGGSCREHLPGCRPAVGGAAAATGGDGAEAITPDEKGGDGGSAEAYAGESGLPWPLDAVVAPLPCANASADPGDGARGGGRCAGPLGDSGGAGGSGGDGGAFAGVYLLRLTTALVDDALSWQEVGKLSEIECAKGSGVATATPSQGGDGGDALSAPGGGGSGGFAYHDIDSNAGTPGTAGVPGALCEELPPGCTRAGDCDDGDACTEDQCEEAQCFHFPIAGCGGCQFVDGVCTGDAACPQGTHCDATCTSCLPGCRASDCTDHCPTGLACSDACGACIASYVGGGGGSFVITGKECQQAGESCQDGCPDGLVCNPSCTACVQSGVSPQGCSQDSGSTCSGQCPPGSQCDVGTCLCVAETVGTKGACSADVVTVGDGWPSAVCVDKCAAGFACDPQCTGCAPVGCFSGDDGTCADSCPEGMHCDAACAGCIPAAEGCTPDTCDAPNCPPGAVCNSGCTACEIPKTSPPAQGCAYVPGAGPSVLGATQVLVCQGQCPVGEYCGAGCACQPEPTKGTPGGAAQQGTCSNLIDAQGKVIGCDSHCGYGATCNTECVACELCSPTTDPGCPADPNPCKATADPGSAAITACDDDCPEGLKCDAACSSCVQCTEDTDCECDDSCQEASCVDGGCACQPKALGATCGEGQTCAEKGCGMPLKPNGCFHAIPKAGALDLTTVVTPEPAGITLKEIQALISAEYALNGTELSFDSTIAGQAAVGLQFEAVTGTLHNASAVAVGEGSGAPPVLQSFVKGEGTAGSFGEVTTPVLGTAQTVVAPAPGAEVLCTEGPEGPICGWCYSYEIKVVGLSNLALLSDSCDCPADQSCVVSGDTPVCLAVELPNSPATLACQASQQGNVATPSGCRWMVLGVGTATQEGLAPGPFSVGLHMDLLDAELPPCAFLNVEVRYVVSGVHTQDPSGCGAVLAAGGGTTVRYVLKGAP